MAEVGFSATFARIGAAVGDLAFETRFNTLQNTVIRRLNDEIQDVRDSGNANKPEALALQRKFTQLTNTQPVLRQYIFDNQSNGLKLLDAANLISNAQAAFSSSDGDPDVITADEVTAFNTARDAIVTQLKRLVQLTHPKITDGNSITYLKNEIATIEALTVSVGVVDPEGTAEGSLTNENRTTYDYLSGLLNKVNNAKDQTVTTIRAANTLSIKSQRQLADIQVRFTELTSVEQARKAVEVEQLQQKYATLLDAISLSYDAQKQFSKTLNAGLSPQPIPQGSVLNLFT